jgi:hypothetical protein
MSTITLEALSPAQRNALGGAALATPTALNGIATRFLALRTKARLFDKPVLASVMGGYARLARDLATAAAGERAEWRLAWQLARIWSEYPDAYVTSTPFAAIAAAALQARHTEDLLARTIRYTRDPVYGWFSGELPFQAFELEQAA